MLIVHNQLNWIQAKQLQGSNTILLSDDSNNCDNFLFYFFSFFGMVTSINQRMIHDRPTKIFLKDCWLKLFGKYIDKHIKDMAYSCKNQIVLLCSSSHSSEVLLTCVTTLEASPGIWCGFKKKKKIWGSHKIEN